MNRVERDGLILYIERHWKLSLLFFILGVAHLAIPFAVSPKKGDPPPELFFGIGAGACVLVAFTLQFKRRAIVIDSARGLLVVLDRLSILTLDRREYPLRDLKVTTSSLAARGEMSFGRRMNFIWIDAPGQPSILFQGNIKNQAKFQDAVTLLRQDLARPALPA